MSWDGHAILTIGCVQQVVLLAEKGRCWPSAELRSVLAVTLEVLFVSLRV